MSRIAPTKPKGLSHARRARCGRGKTLASRYPDRLLTMRIRRLIAVNRQQQSPRRMHKAGSRS